jgi:hypothetical protein
VRHEHIRKQNYEKTAEKEGTEEREQREEKRSRQRDTGLISSVIPTILPTNFCLSLTPGGRTMVTRALPVSGIHILYRSRHVDEVSRSGHLLYLTRVIDWLAI